MVTALTIRGEEIDDIAGLNILEGVRSAAEMGDHAIYRFGNR